MPRYFIWPHSDETTLRSLLQRGLVDLRKTTPGFDLMREGDKVYFCLSHGRYIASAVLASGPYMQQAPVRNEFPMAVDLARVVLISPPVVTGMSPRCVTLLPSLLVNPDWP